MTAKRKDTERTPLLEWIAAGVGLVLTLGLAGIIAWEASHGGPDEAPAILLSVQRIAPAAGGYVVEIEAFNRAGGTAQSVEVEGVLTAGGQAVETSTISFDYVPGHSRRTGGLYFRHDPRQGQLELRPLGYQIP